MQEKVSLYAVYKVDCPFSKISNKVLTREQILPASAEYFEILGKVSILDIILTIAILNDKYLVQIQTIPIGAGNAEVGIRMTAG